MRIQRPGWILLLVGALALASPAARGAEPFFLDPFDTSVFGYLSTVGNVTISWSDVDVDDEQGSGRPCS